MAVLKSEAFDSGSDGVALTTGNTSFGTVTGAFEFESTGALFGGMSGKLNAQIAVSELRWDFTASPDVWASGYYKLAAVPGATGFVWLYARETAAPRWSVYVDATGHAIIREYNGTSWVTLATSTTVIDDDQWFRAVAFGGNTGNTLSLELFTGANLNGTTPTETLSSAWSYSGDVNQLRIGMGTAQTGGNTITMLMDELVVDNASEPPPHATAAATFVLSQTFATDSTAPAGASYEVDATGCGGVAVLTQTGGPTVSVTESPTGVFTFADPGGVAPLTFEVEDTVGGDTDTVALSVFRRVRGESLTLEPGGTATVAADWS